MTTVGIHQPNFFPWIGFFDKVVKSDVFVFLDDVQFQKTGGNWTNRVRLISARGASWETVPVDRSGPGVRKVNEVVFKDFETWRVDFVRSVGSRYRDFPFFSETMKMTEELLAVPTQRLAEFNFRAIRKLCEMVGVNVDFRLSSAFSLTSSSNLRLCEIVRSVGGDAYLMGSGSSGYADPGVFKSYGIEVIPQGFIHPVYSQKGRPNFLEGLSVLDALMCIGSHGVGRLIRG